jgi:rare lipoprotein A
VSDALRLIFRVKSIFLLASASALLAGCAQQPSQTKARSKEYFSSSLYGPASRRVVGEGEAVPRGGGQYLVGRPYTIAGRRYVPSEQPRETQTGMASYYGAAFHGRRTANGEVYDMSSVSAAHPTMPLPSYARVTNMSNGRSIIVRVNDRGPFHSNRVMDVSQKVAEALDFRRMGTAQVKIDYVGRAGLEGSDDNKLLASLRTDGRPANLDGSPSLGIGTMFASSEPPPAPVAPIVPRTPPQRLALVSEAPAAEAPPVVSARVTLPPSNAPLPPVRPFDLGTLPGADVQIGSPRGPQPTYARETFASVAERQTVPQGRPLALMPTPRPAYVESDLPPRR